MKKVLVIILFVIAGFEGAYIYMLKKNLTSLPAYSFYDSKAAGREDDYIQVKGTWMDRIGDKNALSELSQTTLLECRKDLGYCINTTVFFGDGRGQLVMENTLYQIESWALDEISCKGLYIDRKNKAVSRGKNFVNPNSRTSYLRDGYKDVDFRVQL